jgi:hypothetical protein
MLTSQPAPASKTYRWNSFFALTTLAALTALAALAMLTSSEGCNSAWLVGAARIAPHSQGP